MAPTLLYSLSRAEEEEETKVVAGSHRKQNKGLHRTPQPVLSLSLDGWPYRWNHPPPPTRSFMVRAKEGWAGLGWQVACPLFSP